MSEQANSRTDGVCDNHTAHKRCRVCGAPTFVDGGLCRECQRWQAEAERARKDEARRKAFGPYCW